MHFFGAVHNVSNKYFIPQRQVIDNDNIILITNNIQVVKGNAIMVVGQNQAVYVNNIAGANVKNGGALVTDTYAVKLNRQRFKTYTFRNGFNNAPSQNESFDDLLKIARQQEKSGNAYSLHQIAIRYNRIDHY